MRIDSISLLNYGLFRGQHTLSLTPRQKYGVVRPVILFGGLNGAGKTTLLSAIRLALYGKRAIGATVSQKMYEEYLASRIHQGAGQVIPLSDSEVMLEFTYYRLGVPTKVEIKRAWSLHGKSVKESLEVMRDGKSVSELNREQCEAFLNEMVPPGVSDLFFFDGEKISELAEEKGNMALGDAIRKLLGLDVVERLRGDLQVYIRKESQKSESTKSKAEIAEQESKLGILKNEISDIHRALAEVNTEIRRIKIDVEQAESRILGEGGAWGISRKDAMKREDEILLEKHKIEDEIREYINGLFPFSIIKNEIISVKETLKRERSLKEWETASRALQKRQKLFSDWIKREMPASSSGKAQKAFDQIFGDLNQKPGHLSRAKIVHGLSDKDEQRILHWIEKVEKEAKRESENYLKRIEKIDEELSRISIQKKGAPDDASMSNEIEKLSNLNVALGSQIKTKNQLLESGKQSAKEALEILRQMKKREEGSKDLIRVSECMTLAEDARESLNEFSEKVTQKKLQLLEDEFGIAFSRLARKEDITYKARIDPKTFDVHLITKDGQEIPRDRLSAGEKQIYAIAMLDALAKASGRQLPIIIDTPLGRLDSHHRNKLVNGYFPRASHQVIILSTDTEIDKSFYSDMSSNISHAFEIVYDQQKGSSDFVEGYFWRNSSRENENAA